MKSAKPGDRNASMAISAIAIAARTSASLSATKIASSAAITMLARASVFMPRACSTAAENAAASAPSCMRSRCVIASPIPIT